MSYTRPPGALKHITSHGIWNEPECFNKIFIVFTFIYQLIIWFFYYTSCVANYIIARSMKEGKGSQCQEVQGAYQEPRRSLWLSLRNQSSIIFHHHISSPSFIIIIHHHHYPSSKSSSISHHLASSSIIIIQHHNPSSFTSIIINCHPSSSTIIMIHDHDPSSSSTIITVIMIHHHPSS